MSLIFSILLKEHPNLGKLIYPYFIQPREKDTCDVIERITGNNLQGHEIQLNDEQIKLVKILEECSDQIFV